MQQNSDCDGTSHDFAVLPSMMSVWPVFRVRQLCQMCKAHSTIVLSKFAPVDSGPHDCSKSFTAVRMSRLLISPHKRAVAWAQDEEDCTIDKTSFPQNGTEQVQ